MDIREGYWWPIYWKESSWSKTSMNRLPGGILEELDLESICSVIGWLLKSIPSRLKTFSFFLLAHFLL